MKTLLVASMIVYSTLAAGVASASPLHFDYGHKSAKVRMVSLRFRNERPQPVTVKVGDLELTLAPGDAIQQKLKDGENVLAENGFDQETGTVLAHITPDLADDIIVFIPS